MSSTSLEHPADAAPRPVDLLALVAHHRAEADRSEVAILGAGGGVGRRAPG